MLRKGRIDITDTGTRSTIHISPVDISVYPSRSNYSNHGIGFTHVFPGLSGSTELIGPELSCFLWEDSFDEGTNVDSYFSLIWRFLPPFPYNVSLSYHICVRSYVPLGPLNPFTFTQVHWPFVSYPPPLTSTLVSDFRLRPQSITIRSIRYNYSQ